MEEAKESEYINQETGCHLLVNVEHIGDEEEYDKARR